MKVPLQTSSGTCYEQSQLEIYVKKYGTIDPCTRKEFGSINNCYLNRALQKDINDFFKNNPLLIDRLKNHDVDLVDRQIVTDPVYSLLP